MCKITIWAIQSLPGELKQGMYQSHREDAGLPTTHSAQADKAGQDTVNTCACDTLDASALLVA